MAKLRNAMIVDTDVHHGNGTASIFADDCFGLHDFHSSGK